MGKKSKSAVKKKRISKHMLMARDVDGGSNNDDQGQQKQVQQPPTESLPLDPTSQPSNSSNSKKDSHIKAPEEAASYLMNWKASRNESNASSNNWKFNKNTQSWLIRHMYEVDKVPKSTFSVLLEYLEGLQGQRSKSRIVADATRRARRYKDYEKAEVSADMKQDDKNKEGKEDVTTPSSLTDNGTKSKSDVETNDDGDDEDRWKSLNDQDKRKEYKRARKILDLLKSS